MTPNQPVIVYWVSLAKSIDMVNSYLTLVRRAHRYQAIITRHRFLIDNETEMYVLAYRRCTKAFMDHKSKMPRAERHYI